MSNIATNSDQSKFNPSLSGQGGIDVRTQTQNVIPVQESKSPHQALLEAMNRQGPAAAFPTPVELPNTQPLPTTLGPQPSSFQVGPSPFLPQNASLSPQPEKVEDPYGGSVLQNQEYHPIQNQLSPILPVVNGQNSPATNQVFPPQQNQSIPQVFPRQAFQNLGQAQPIQPQPFSQSNFGPANQFSNQLPPQQFQVRQQMPVGLNQVKSTETLPIAEVNQLPKNEATSPKPLQNPTLPKQMNQITEIFGKFFAKGTGPSGITLDLKDLSHSEDQIIAMLNNSK